MFNQKVLVFFTKQNNLKELEMFLQHGKTELPYKSAVRGVVKEEYWPIIPYTVDSRYLDLAYLE